jgi:hypothetical protein
MYVKLETNKAANSDIEKIKLNAQKYNNTLA